MGLGLGLLADSELSAAELERHLTRLGFGGRFQFVLSSVELGTTKVEKDGYRAASAPFAAPPQRHRLRGESLAAPRSCGELACPRLPSTTTKRPLPISICGGLTS